MHIFSFHKDSSSLIGSIPITGGPWVSLNCGKYETYLASATIDYYIFIDSGW